VKRIERFLERGESSGVDDDDDDDMVAWVGFGSGSDFPLFFLLPPRSKSVKQA
jgi:hypothetical protein